MVDFDETFWESYGHKLRKPDLACLRTDANLYSTLMLQPSENLKYDNAGLWMANKERGNEKFLRFFDLAITTNTELAITPEYSCPWEIICQNIATNKLPEEHNLWVVGCQSIHPNQLGSIIDNFQNVKWIYDESLLKKHLTVDNDFFDPVCLIFKTMDAQGESHTVIIVQFKTEHFGGAGNAWERDHLIKGKTFFVLSNQIASTRLIVLICSDSLAGFNFNTLQEAIFLHHPLLLIHIQINQSPFQANYKLYRNLLFAKGGLDFPKEIITLNWARSLELNDEKWNVYGGSGFYLKSNKLNLEDDRINQNHQLGLYYTNWYDRRAHIYFLSYDEHIFLVKNTKPSQISADPSQHQRTGPEIMIAYHWENGWKPVTNVDSGFYELCENIENAGGNISYIKTQLDPINTERLVALTLGDIDLETKDWFLPQKLPSFIIAENEYNNRLNFDHDPEINAKQKRHDKMSKYIEFNDHILTNSTLLPPDLKEPILKFDLTQSKETQYLLNLHPAGGGHKWTGVFLGYTSFTYAQLTRHKLIQLFQDTQRGKNVIVWYHQGGETRRVDNGQNRPTISDNTNTPANSYKRNRD